MICSPSFLSSDFTKLEEEINSINQSRWLHFDVMDGKFVNNFTYDHLMVKRIKAFSDKFFDVHLMIEHPDKYIDDYINEGANLITFHYEAIDDPLSLIKDIRVQLP